MARVVARAVALAIGLALLTALLLGGGVAEAHGKEVNIAITCVAPDPSRPLTKVCTALLKYLDGDPVTKADFQLTAFREGRAEEPLGPVKFKPLEEPGLYSATISFPAYGKWRMKFAVNEPDSGEAELVEELLPPAPGASPEIRARLQVVFAFGLADARNIALRVAHLLAAVAWFALSALVLAFSYLVPVEERWRLLRRLATAFPWAAGASLLVLGVSGLYSARYNAPTRSPGLFAPEVFERLPFGEAYLVAFLAKMALAAAIVGATVALAVALRRAYRSPLPAVAGAATGAAFGPAAGRWTAWLAAINLLLGFLALANVVVLGYLHIISHVGAAAGG